MATNPRHVTRFATGPLHGTALALYFVLLPYVVVTKWSLSAQQTNTPLIRLALVLLSLFWLTFLAQLGYNVIRLRRGHRIGKGGSAWLAGLVVVVLPFLLPHPTVASGTTPPATISTPYEAQPSGATWSLPRDSTESRTSTREPRRPQRRDVALGGAMPLALIAKRCKESLLHDDAELSDTEIEETIELLRHYDPTLVTTLRSLIGERRNGVLRVSASQPTFSVTVHNEPMVVCVLGEDEDGCEISFAREGGQLSVPATWSTKDVVSNLICLHEGGRVVATKDPTELLRALATRTLGSTLVVYLGAPHDLDDQLRNCTVVLEHVAADPTQNVTANAWKEVASSSENHERHGEVRAELLRSDPRITGLVEPFTDTLRRRCVEMVCYLALHQLEPVTGDRLRTRVLTHADIDASTRTLANTASAVRRSLGSDAAGPRLHSVTSLGLYVTHDLTSDVEIFGRLIARARKLASGEAASLAREALEMVHGEPLASALRGFEWFLAEGHAARLARDAEWAALCVHHHSLANGDFELAYWALEKGRLIDPYSDALVAALARVPRLREFGGDGTGGTQHQTVGAGSAEAVGWSFDRLSDQIA